jgi:hypothetical protein
MGLVCCGISKGLWMIKVENESKIVHKNYKAALLIFFASYFIKPSFLVKIAKNFGPIY